MPIEYHPAKGTILNADFSQGFKAPEMIKRRMCVVVSPPISRRVGLCTVVPLSTTTPDPVMPYHYYLEIPFQLPSQYKSQTCWVKADMICAVGFHRLSLMRLGKDALGRRNYQTSTLSNIHLKSIEQCILASLGLGEFDKKLQKPYID